jgi:hypothetical protein
MLPALLLISPELIHPDLSHSSSVIFLARLLRDFYTGMVLVLLHALLLSDKHLQEPKSSAISSVTMVNSSISTIPVVQTVLFLISQEASSEKISVIILVLDLNSCFIMDLVWPVVLILLWSNTLNQLIVRDIVIINANLDNISTIMVLARMILAFILSHWEMRVHGSSVTGLVKTHLSYIISGMIPVMLLVMLLLPQHHQDSITSAAINVKITNSFTMMALAHQTTVLFHTSTENNGERTSVTILVQALNTSGMTVLVAHHALILF